MKEIVDSLLAAEKDAQAIIGQAQKKAQEIRAGAETEYSEGVTRAREEARIMLQQKIEAARKEAADRYQAALDAENSGNRDFWENKKDQVGEITDQIASFIITPEFERE